MSCLTMTIHTYHWFYIALYYDSHRASFHISMRYPEKSIPVRHPIATIEFKMIMMLVVITKSDNDNGREILCARAKCSIACAIHANIILTTEAISATVLWKMCPVFPSACSFRSLLWPSKNNCFNSSVIGTYLASTQFDANFWF